MYNNGPSAEYSADGPSPAFGDIRSSMEELSLLAGACDMEVVGSTIQNMDRPNTAFYIGPGKVEEIAEEAAALKAELVIFDESLSPAQLRNLQRQLHLPVMDRSTLILQIFASRAKSREARLQVEAAQLQYMLPRLVGLHDALTRQGGASGSMSSKGEGEKQLELDRRRLEQRLHALRRELKEVEEERRTQRKKRSEGSMPRVAMVGYTNSGKSTLMNTMLSLHGEDKADPEALQQKQVLVKDMLFATLDTTVRRISPEGHHPFLLSDTVGFVNKLPHHLVEAFRSTLEEAAEADVILHVMDCSDPMWREQEKVTERTLQDLKADHIPRIRVFNKADKRAGQLRADNITPMVPYGKSGQGVFISAKEGEGIPALLDSIEEALEERYAQADLLIPYTAGNVVSYLKENANVSSMEYLPEGVHIVASCRKEDRDRFAMYQISF
ncbi:MAG: GTPase HflX [Lachnospiraceae bacterium]|nr:GTPase HflX [Lachnospiraceae bacterium]